MVLKWIQQLFWNVLDFKNILQYLAYSVTCGMDYQVYFIIHLFKLLETRIKSCTLSHTLAIFLNGMPFESLDIVIDVDYLKMLESKYRGLLLDDLK